MQGITMDNIQWETIVHTLSRNKETVIPVVVFSTLGGLFFMCRRKIFGEQTTPTQSAQLDQPNQNKKQNHILNIPPETRKYIWNQLCYKDILKLRLVCEDIKNDVDTHVGLYGHLNNRDEERFSFFRNLTLKKCLVTELVEYSEPTLFASPYHLRCLSISERSPLSLETFHNILWDCNNLQQLFMHFYHQPGSSTTTDLSRIVLNTLQTKSRLRELQFVKISNSRTDKSIPRDISNLSFPVSNRLTYVDVQIPDVLPGHLPEWKYFLEQQSNLSTLIIDFGGIYWKFFSTIISKNQETLTGICLYQLKHTDENLREESPFDWGMLHGCSQLEIFQVTGSRWITEPMHSVNFSTFPVNNLLELCVRRVVLTREDVRRIYQDMPHLRSGSFENMGNDGDTAALELMMENRQLEIDREIDEWENAQRNVEIASDCLFYFCAVVVFSLYAAIIYRYYYLDENFENPDEFIK